MLPGELAAAFELLTRLPVGWIGRAHANDDMARAVWAYPIVGVAIGGLGAAGYWLSIGMGLPPPFAAICTLAITVLATGGLHEDALADMADGFGGGRTRVRKLEIMRDSRVGSFGVLALILSTAARATAITSIATPSKVAVALIGAGSLGRGAMLVLLILLRPARKDGSGYGLRTAGMVRGLVGLILSTAVAFLLLPFVVAAGAALVTLLVALCLSLLSWRQIAGYTGDVLGATEVAAECAVLGLLAAAGNIST